MIDHAAGFGNVFRSHDISLHVNNTVGLAKTAGPRYRFPGKRQTLTAKEL
jgi:hypothetical protein